jgi:hypothetical protein
MQPAGGRDRWFAEIPPRDGEAPGARVAQSSATPRMQDALTALEPPNGRIAPMSVVQAASPSLECRRSPSCGGSCSDARCGWKAAVPDPRSQ